MERGSDKHSPLADEEIKKDTQGLEKGEPSESRVEDFRKDEEIEPEESEDIEAELGASEAAPQRDRRPDSAS
jgi:hypothetical protein